MNENGWNEWSRHVLAELERLNERIEQISQKQGELLVEIARLHGYRSIELRIGRYSLTVSVSGWEWRLSASANRSSVGLTIGPLSMHVWEYARPPC